MFQLKTPLSQVIALLKRRLEAVNPDKLLRTATTTLLALQIDRIFVQGLKSNLQPIGSYKSTAYVAYRLKKYKRASQTINLVLTGQMQGDYTLVPLPPKAYGLGFINNFNLLKADWAEAKFGNIFNPTQEEKRIVRNIIENTLKNLLK